MSAEPQLFRINPESRESERIEEVNFAQLGLQERRDIQEWIAANPGILGEDLLIIGKEFSGFDRTDERLDLLAVDADGKLVVIELKRDDTGADAHWQAIKYASYLHRASADDLGILNNDQRIILASHRFAPEVTSAAVWLNEKASGEDLITCIQLTPYKDAKTDSLYIQANTIIPVPGVDDYVIGIGESSSENRPIVRRVGSLAQTFTRNRNDDVTRFLRGVSERVVSSLPGDIKPDRQSRWAGDHGFRYFYRYYRWWYSRRPWGNEVMVYLINLSREKDSPDTYQADVGIGWWPSADEDVVSRVAELHIYDDQTVGKGWIGVSRRSSALDDSFADTLADTLRRFIEVITPRIEDIQNERNEEEA